MATDVSVKGVRVLIVDDASAVRSLLHKVLEAEGDEHACVRLTGPARTLAAQGRKGLTESGRRSSRSTTAPGSGSGRSSSASMIAPHR